MTEASELARWDERLARDESAVKDQFEQRGPYAPMVLVAVLLAGSALVQLVDRFLRLGATAGNVAYMVLVIISASAVAKWAAARQRR